MDCFTNVFPNHTFSVTQLFNNIPYPTHFSEFNRLSQYALIGFHGTTEKGARGISQYGYKKGDHHLYGEGIYCIECIDILVAQDNLIATEYGSVLCYNFMSISSFQETTWCNGYSYSRDKKVIRYFPVDNGILTVSWSLKDSIKVICTKEISSLNYLLDLTWLLNQEYFITPPLISAIYKQDIQLIDKYIKDVNQVDRYGKSPLVYAMDMNYILIFEYLLQMGADPNTFLDYDDVEHQTVLFKAVLTQKIAFIQILLKYGANIQLVDIYNKSPLYYALEGGKRERTIEKGYLAVMCKLLEESVQLSFSLAIERGDEGMVELLLDCGAVIE